LFTLKSPAAISKWLDQFKEDRQSRILLESGAVLHAIPHRPRATARDLSTHEWLSGIRPSGEQLLTLRLSFKHYFQSAA
jgi:hypothetical protein